jgi:CheY-like chemotaxis protein
VPLDEFKTQVLLLHSEQSTLDTLSSGFGDRFTVHCATSGSEALNTLGDTPINVIVTAQNLPGMSGIEALREAKKRSPDTIGILLAEDEDKNLEAMVGEREVFQIVRGDVTGDSISKMVDDATQQMRLIALANSANDAAADVDETSAQHIVMETSENGSTIISDGTGRMPVLDPTKISAASAVGSHSVDLLVMNTKQDDQLAMHGVAYPLCIELRDTPILML